MLVIVLWTVAEATEVVWVGPAADARQLAMVAGLPGVEGTVRTPAELRAAASDRGPADEAAWAGLDRTLKEVRAFETKLDGELVILRDLERPIREITLLEGESQRDALYAALSYQGFAAWRFYGETIGTDPAAEPWRAPLRVGAAPRPWADAVAMEPARRPTAYELAEAGARTAFEELAPRLVEERLPGLLVVGPLPDRSALWLDGREVTVDAARQIRVVPGRHLAHVELDGHVVARWVVQSEAAGTTGLDVPLSDAVWSAWLGAFTEGRGEAPPAAVQPLIAAWGGEVYLAKDDGHGVRAVLVTADAATPVKVEKPEEEGQGGVKVGFAVGLGGGWLSSGDFYTQDPVGVARTRAAVNAGTLSGLVDVHLQSGWFRAKVALDQVVTLGPDHVALTGEEALRYRPAVLVGVGIPYAQVVGGWMFPYHPAVGAHATIPLYGGLELTGSFLAGLPMSIERDGGTTYDTLPVYSAWGGLAWRFNGRR